MTVLLRCDCVELTPDQRLPGIAIIDTDWSADARKFTSLMAAGCSLLGQSVMGRKNSSRGDVKFVFNSSLSSVDTKHAGATVTHVTLTTGERIACDGGLVLAAGMHTGALSKVSVLTAVRT